MRIGIIGGGRIVQRKYIPILPKHIKLIIEPSEKVVKTLVEIRDREKLSYTVLHKWDQWENSFKVVGPLDAMVIASPTGYHLNSITTLMQYWKGPIIVEKPLATNYQEALGIYDAEDMFPKSVQIHPVFQNREHASVQFLKHLLHSQALGEILHVDAFLGWRRDYEYFDKHPWRMDKKQGGGVVGDHLTHVFDLLLHLIGKFGVRFQCRGCEHFGPSWTAPDTAFMSGKLYNSFNTTFSIFGSNAVGPQDLGTRLTVYGTKGFVELSGFFWNVVRCELKKSPSEEAERILQLSIEENQFGDPLVGHRKFLEKTLIRIKTGLSPIVSRDEALFTVGLAEEALK